MDSTEPQNEDWRCQLANAFPKREAAKETAEWIALKQRLAVGDRVTGVVVARAEFGVWLDLGVGFPGLMLVPDLAGLSPEAYQSGDSCRVGSTMPVAVYRFNDAEFRIRVGSAAPPGDLISDF
jgi:ribosomal protein S1